MAILSRELRRKDEELKGRTTNRIIYLLIWSGGFLTLLLYTQSAHVGTGLFIILGGLLIMMLALVGGSVRPP